MGFALARLEMPRHVGLNRLTAFQVRNARPGILEDGGGLRLVVASSSAKRWVLRLTVDRRRRDLGLGSALDVPLSEVRDLAVEIRKRVKLGQPIDQLLAKHRGQGPVEAGPRPSSTYDDGLTVRGVFRSFFADKKRQLSEGKHQRQWHTMLETHAFATLGGSPIDAVTTRMIADTLRPIWHTKPETARKVLQRLSAIFAYAAAIGLRETGDPTAGVAIVLGQRRRPVRHHPALDWQRMPEFMAKLYALDRLRPVNKLGLEFLVLTAARSGEVRNATLDQVDVIRRLWTVPALNMKSRRAHEVPLSSAAIDVLHRAAALPGEIDHRRQAGAPSKQLVFSRDGKRLSENAFEVVLDQLGFEEVTPHGFRSSFRTWAAEHGVDHDVAEACLAHQPRDKLLVAYRRTTFLEQRRTVMERWADYLLTSNAGHQSRG